jgi:hypothetical protein
MPSLDLEFEVYCNTCGEGLCNESETGTGRTRGVPQVRVNACYKCMEKKDDLIKELQDRIDELEQDLERLE